eukprot:TRINITY_DN9956_c0_g1_i1.p1 TRINITY_DN9956_c0_g1~~TRINITY_DN9956_c0_g1_i1.p1  ORF type:complete len:599 (-),score=135.97 TRINITY_DN9956_c0_g1_i1:418-2193(-)
MANPFRVDANTKAYFAQLNMDLFVNRRTDDEDGEPEEQSVQLQELLENIYSEAEGKESVLAQDQLCSKILEKILRASNPNQLTHFYQNLKRKNDRYTDLLFNNYSSFVIQTLVSSIGSALQKTTDENQRKPLLKCLTDLRKDLSTNWSKVCYDKNARHVATTLMEILKALSALPAIKPLQMEIAKDFASLDLPSMVYDTNASPVVQSVIEMLGPENNKVLKKALCFDQPNAQKHVQDLIYDKFGSHFMQKVFQVASPEVFLELYNRHIRKNLMEMISHSSANFVAQECIAHLNHEGQVKMTFEELAEHIPSLLSSQKTSGVGAVFRLTEACKKFQTKQKELIKIFNKYAGKNNFIKMMIDLEAQKTPSNFGARIVQELFFFEAEVNQFIFKNFAKLEESYIFKLCKAPIGSFVIEKFLESPFVSQDMRGDLIKKIQSRLFELACTQSGSICVRNLYETSDVTRKQLVVNALAPKVEELAANRYGNFIIKRCRLRLYKEKQEVWLNSEEGNKRKRAVFSDILEEKPKSTTTKPTRKNLLEDDDDEKETEVVQKEVEEAPKKKRKTQERKKDDGEVMDYSMRFMLNALSNNSK